MREIHTWVCGILALMPHDGGMLIMTGMGHVTPIDILKFAYYPVLLIFATLVTIKFGLLRTPEEKELARIAKENHESISEI